MDATKPSRAFVVTSVVFIAAAAAFGFLAARTPLLDVVGYEFGAAMAVFLAAAGGTLGIIAGRETRRPDISPSVSAHYIVNVKYGRCAAAGLLCLALPLAIVAAGAFYVRKCNIGTGLPLFLAIAVPTLFHYTAAGLAAGRIFRRAWAAALALFGYFLATSVYSFVLFMIGSQWNLPNLTIGVFSLSGFNGFDLVVPDSFYASRLLALFMSAFFLAAAILANPQQHYPRPRQDTYFGLRGIAAAALVFIVCLAFFPDQTGLGSGRRTLNRELSVKLSLPNAVLHYSPGALKASQARRAARYTEWYIREIKDAVPIGPRWKIHVYLYKDSEQKRRLVNAGNIYFSAPWLHEVHIDAHSIDTDIYKHELTHAAMAEHARGIFGTPYNMGVVEGIAEAVQMDYFRGPDFQETFAASVQAKVLAPAQQTLTNLGFGATNMWKSYSMSGGFTGFLIYRYGPEKYARFYGNPDAQKIYGKSMKSLNGEWTEWLKAAPVSAFALRNAEREFNDVEFPPFYRTTCPRVGSRAGLGDPEERLDALHDEEKYSDYSNLCEEFYEKDANPEWLVKQARMYLETGRPKKALAAAGRALAAKKISHGTRAAALYIEGFALAALGRFDEAVPPLEECRALGFMSPDEIEMTIRIFERKQLRGIPLHYYLFRRGRGVKTIEKAIAADPGFGVTYGELAEQISKWDYATPDEYLAGLRDLTDEFIALTPGLEAAKINALVRLGDAYFDAEKYGEAAAAFGRIKPLARNERDLFIARRGIERAGFFENFSLKNRIKRKD